MANSIKQQLADDLEQVKTQGGDRIQRIKAIVKTAFSEAVTEVKDGTQEVKTTSQKSFQNVIQTVAPRDAAEAVVTVIAKEESNVEPLSQDGEIPEIFASEAAPAPQPEATVETPRLSLIQALLKATGLKAKSLADAQYSKVKAEFPERLAQVKEKTTVWDEQLSDRYGDDYAGIKQKWSKAVTWYKAKLEEGQAVNAQHLERQQAQKAEILSDLGVKVAQKEEAVKQQIGQTLRTITVNAQP